MRAELLDHEPADPGTGVEGGENEKRLEHDRKVIPERDQPGPEGAAEDLGHPDRQGGGPAGPAKERRLFDGAGHPVDLLGGHDEAPLPDRLDRLGDIAAERR